MLVERLISNNRTIIHPEAYRLTQPFSPHKSAALDGIHIDLDKINLPKTDNQLIIEGAGGLMVPLNEKDLIIDLIKKFDAEVVLVSKNYLGSINHTLLSVELLRSYAIPIRKLIFSGESNQSSEDVIYKRTGLDIIRIPFLEKVNRESLRQIGDKFNF
jgi:dethiobiotin synthetase